MVCFLTHLLTVHTKWVVNGPLQTTHFLLPFILLTVIPPSGVLQSRPKLLLFSHSYLSPQTTSTSTYTLTVKTSVVNSPVQSDLEPKSNWTDRLGPPSQTGGIVNISPINLSIDPINLISLTPSTWQVKSNWTELWLKNLQVKPSWPHWSDSVQFSSTCT